MIARPPVLVGGVGQNSDCVTSARSRCSSAIERCHAAAAARPIAAAVTTSSPATPCAHALPPPSGARWRIHRGGCRPPRRPPPRIQLLRHCRRPSSSRSASVLFTAQTCASSVSPRVLLQPGMIGLQDLCEQVGARGEIEIGRERNRWMSPISGAGSSAIGTSR